MRARNGFILSTIETNVGVLWTGSGTSGSIKERELKLSQYSLIRKGMLHGDHLVFDRQCLKGYMPSFRFLWFRGQRSFLHARWRQIPSYKIDISPLEWTSWRTFLWSGLSEAIEKWHWLACPFAWSHVMWLPSVSMPQRQFDRSTQRLWIS
jgi:hypothetical protein